MPLMISDELLQESGMDAEQARLEIACRLFETGRLSLWTAAKWAELRRAELEGELLERRIPLYHPTPEEVNDDLQALDRLDSDTSPLRGSSS